MDLALTFLTEAGSGVDGGFLRFSYILVLVVLDPGHHLL
jgi:hypothetical protein